MNPGTLSNTTLVSKNGDEYCKDLVIGVTCTLLPLPVVQKLIDIYSGDPPLGRQVVSMGGKVMFVDIYPSKIKMSLITSSIMVAESQDTVVFVSSVCTTEHLHGIIRQHFGINGTHIKLWVLDESTRLLPEVVTIDGTKLRLWTTSFTDVIGTLLV